MSACLQAIIARLRRRELYKYVNDALIPQASPLPPAPLPYPAVYVVAAGH